MNWVSIGSDNGLSPIRRQAIIWTNAGILSIEPLGTNFSENWTKILIFSFKKMRLKMSSAKVAAILSGGDELRHIGEKPSPEPWGQTSVKFKSKYQNTFFAEMYLKSLYTPKRCWQNISHLNEASCVLTHLPLVVHTCISEPGHHWFRQELRSSWFRQSLVTCTVLRNYLNQCWHIVLWNLKKKPLWNWNQNTKPFIHENLKWQPFCQWGKKLMMQTYLTCHACLHCLQTNLLSQESELTSYSIL